jgi:hypothetical protein
VVTWVAAASRKTMITSLKRASWRTARIIIDAGDLRGRGSHRPVRRLLPPRPPASGLRQAHRRVTQAVIRPIALFLAGELQGAARGRP